VSELGPELERGPRVWAGNDAPVARDGDFVLYWMIATRRTSWSFAVDRAVAWARRLDRPLVVLEALRVDYPWASDRLHRFVIDGMRDQAEALARSDVLYHPYVEPKKGAGEGLLKALAERACVIVTDHFPAFFLPRMVAAAAERMPVRLERVDSNGLMPLSAHEKDFGTAAAFRRHAQSILPRWLDEPPVKTPLARRRVPKPRGDLLGRLGPRWPAAGRALLEGDAEALARLPIDHAVPVAPFRGGERAARRRLRRFVREKVPRYAEQHADPDADATSHLSPYLHFGHVSAHEIVDAVARAEGWTRARLDGGRPTGARRGWWGMREGAEAFLDQLVVWRELGYNTCHQRPEDYDAYESLPAWARETLEAHADDERPHRYGRARLERADTHDPLWNASQRQLLREGWCHNFMRLLWGKKILEWSRSPRLALETMTALMNRWSLDGRDPNSYSGYFWTLGRYDRGWPERPVFGKVRSMSSERTAQKVDLEAYLARYGPRRGDEPGGAG
jgi:deoxyribodipyrimidine photo-lyase